MSKEDILQEQIRELEKLLKLKEARIIELELQISKSISNTHICSLYINGVCPTCQKALPYNPTFTPLINPNYPYYTVTYTDSSNG